MRPRAVKELINVEVSLSKTDVKNLIKMDMKENDSKQEDVH